MFSFLSFFSLLTTTSLKKDIYELEQFYFCSYIFLLNTNPLLFSSEELIDDKWYFMPYPWQMTFQSPASPFMEKLVGLHNFIMFFLVLVVFFVFVWLLVMITNFRDNPLVPPRRIVQIQHNSFLEFIWTVVPFLILILIFSSSASLIYDGANKTTISQTVKVIGSQWYWSYQTYQHASAQIKEQLSDFYDSYMKEVPLFVGVPRDLNENQTEKLTSLDSSVYAFLVYHPFRLLKTDQPLYTPCRVWTRFLISSRDVIHSWAIPSLGIKCDAIPGRLNEIVSFINQSGEYFGQCSELCGINHGFMPVHIWAYTATPVISSSFDSFSFVTAFDLNDGLEFNETIITGDLY